MIRNPLARLPWHWQVITYAIWRGIAYPFLRPWPSVFGLMVYVLAWGWALRLLVLIGQFR